MRKVPQSRTRVYLIGYSGIFHDAMRQQPHEPQEPLTELAMRCGVSRDNIAATLGITENQLWCLNRGHAWLDDDGILAAAQCLGRHCSITDVKRAS